MSEEKGFLTKQLEDLAKAGLDSLIKANGITEIASDAAIAMFVPLVDNNILDSQVPESVKTPIREAGQLIIDGNDAAASEKLSEALAEITKGEESDEVKAAYKDTIKAFISWIKVGLSRKSV